LEIQIICRLCLRVNAGRDRQCGNGSKKSSHFDLLGWGQDHENGTSSETRRISSSGQPPPGRVTRSTLSCSSSPSRTMRRQKASTSRSASPLRMHDAASGGRLVDGRDDADNVEGVNGEALFQQGVGHGPGGDRVAAGRPAASAGAVPGWRKTKRPGYIRREISTGGNGCCKPLYVCFFLDLCPIRLTMCSG
jgi:hypothetical protein